jgi:urea transport system permease protein
LVNGFKSWSDRDSARVWLYFSGALFIGVTLYLPNGVVGILNQFRAHKGGSK